LAALHARQPFCSTWHPVPSPPVEPTQSHRSIQACATTSNPAFIPQAGASLITNIKHTGNALEAFVFRSGHAFDSLIEHAYDNRELILQPGPATKPRLSTARTAMLTEQTDRAPQ